VSPLQKPARLGKLLSSRQKIACQKEGMMLIAPVLYTAANVDPASGAVLASMASDQIY